MSHVYFVRSQRTGLIKIGYSAGLESRLRQLRTVHGPIDIMGIAAGDRNTERAFHRKFRRYRVSGEWFKASASIIDEAASHTLPVPKSTTRDFHLYLSRSLYERVAAQAKAEHRSVPAHVAYLVARGIQAENVA